MFIDTRILNESSLMPAGDKAKACGSIKMCTMQSGTGSRPHNNWQLREENRGGFRIIELQEYVVICRERGFSEMLTKNGANREDKVT